ncbi:MAG TPA: sulfur carrier protein ThiS [Planctomycetota bacterium]|nr:sulfur carrier protein ThiS [Planctomycetota bacterium]
MKLQVNGEARELEDGLTLARFIAGLELGKVRVAVERNFDIVPRDQYVDTVLRDGDRLEIVTFVGGG